MTAKIAHTGMHHLAFEDDDTARLLFTYQRLRDQGTRLDACLDHGLTARPCYADPNGTRVEMHTDHFADRSSPSEWMRTAAEFQTNPIRDRVDPEQLFEARRARTAAAELHRCSFSGESCADSPFDFPLPSETGAGAAVQAEEELL